VEYAYNIQYPWALVWAVIFAVAIIIFMKINLIKFRTKKEYDDYKKSARTMRVLVGVMRSLVVVCLMLALASPYMQKETTTKGKPSLTILTDNSTSFEIFEQGIGEELAKEIRTIMPVNIKNIAYGTRSAIGDAILSNMQGNDNLLIITDGNVNEGRDLGDIIKYQKSKSKIVGLPIWPLEIFLPILKRIRLISQDISHYESLVVPSYVSIKKAEKLLKWHPEKSNNKLLLESYKWYESSIINK